MSDNTPTPAELEQIVQAWIQEHLGQTEKARAQNGPYSTKMVEEELADLRRVQAAARSALARRDYSLHGPWAATALAERGFKVDPGSPEFKTLCRELAKAYVRVAEIEIAKSEGTYDGDLPSVGRSARIGPEDGISASRTPSNRAAQSKEPLVVSRVYENYEQEMLRGKAWIDKTQRENHAVIDTLIEVMGDRPIADFDRDLARSYKEQLLHFPVNRNKDRRYRDKTLGEISSMAKVDKLSVTSINNRLIKTSGFFAWAKDQGFISENPFSDMTIRTKDRAKDQVLPFDQEELRKIFTSPVYRENAWKVPWQFWMPLLGLFTGARIEEICQLHLEDIREIDGVWCLAITDEGERQLKTKSSKRVVPIHPELIRIGLLQHAEKLRRQRNSRLFPELRKASGKFSHYPSKWFGDLKRSLGFQERKKVFHSFRHTMASKLRDVHAHDYEIKRLLGHETGSETHDRYGTDEPKPLFDVISKLDFGVDLSQVIFPS